jgi:hypothetical protein
VENSLKTKRNFAPRGRFRLVENGLLTIKYRAIVDYIQRKRVELCVSFAKPQLYVLVRPRSSSRTKDNLKYYYISEIEYAI